MIQIVKNEVFGHFLKLGSSDRLQISYFEYTKWSWHVGYHIAHAGSFKHDKNDWMIQNAKNGVFDHFLECGPLVRLDIEYFDSTKRS